MTQTLTIQQQYLANWHDSFVKYYQSLLSSILCLEVLPEATSEDKKCLGLLKTVVISADVYDVEKDLADGKIKHSTLDKIEGLNKRIVEICLEYFPMSPMVREFWKRLAHLKIESDKNAELNRLTALKIYLVDG